MVIKIEVNFGDLMSNLNSVISRLRNPERGLRQNAGIGLASLLENFEFEGSGYPNRTKWAPLAPSTVKERSRKYSPSVGAHPILTRTGKLKHSIRYKVRGNILTYYTQTKYAPYHVTGTFKMPARNFMQLNQDSINRIAKGLTNWIFENLGKQRV